MTAILKSVVLTVLILIIHYHLTKGQEKYFPVKEKAVLENLEEWQDIKFGLLMHWGPYSQWGIVESWSICGEDEGWCVRKIDNYYEYKLKYEKLKETFNPVDFNPDKWASAAKNAGMKYVIFTTKHHDGFCMFDSEYTDYKVTDESCPFSDHPKANITKEIFDSFRSEGFKVGAYFSKPDWHSEYYWWPNFPAPDRNVNYDPLKYPERWNNYVEFTHNQILEILTDYGPVDILWLDGGWVAKLSEEEINMYYAHLIDNSPSGFIKKRIVSQDIKMDLLVEKCREIQPGLIVVDRAVPGPNQNYLTPENRVPEEALPYPWESCIIAGGGWSWVEDAKYKPANELIHMLIDIVSKGGNLLLNIAPGPDGQWHKEAYYRLERIGTWMNINGESIYSTRAVAPYKTDNICYTQSKDGKFIYAHYLVKENKENMPEIIKLKDFADQDFASVELLGAKEKLKWEINDNQVEIMIPETFQSNPVCRHAWVFKLIKSN